MNSGSLNFKNSLIISSTLFGMFFGVGNLIFPIQLGQDAGCNFIPSSIGFLLTAVTLPVLAVITIGVSKSNSLFDLSKKVGDKFSFIFTTLLYLTIGPFYGIPRCASVSFSICIEPFLPQNSDLTLSLFVYTLLFFIVVLLFSFKPKGITTWIGKIINPAFLTLFVILLFSALSHFDINAFSTPAVEPYQNSPFFGGFISGYETMDAMAGLACGIVIINSVKRMGVKDESSLSKSIVKSSILTALVMSIIYVLTILLGLMSVNLCGHCANGAAALAQVVQYYLGDVGKFLLSITVILASLKTAIGLVTCCSEAFVDMYPNFISYKKWAICMGFVGLLLSNVGLDLLIHCSIPLLCFLYPIAIVLIILPLFSNVFNNSKYVYGFTVAFAALAAFYEMLVSFSKNAINIEAINSLSNWLGSFCPIFEYGFSWVIFALIGFVVGYGVYKCKGNNVSV